MSQSKSNSPSYPNAYCVKCGTHTDTLKKHTVLLTNNSRALKGVCATCESEVYKILPKIKAAHATRAPLTADEQKKYPDAFCVKCQTHTPTTNAHTVMLENASRAVTGSCQSCGSDVYRILGMRGEKAPAKVETPVAVAKDVRRVPVTRRADVAKGSALKWSYVAAAGVIAGIIAAFFVYAVL